MSVAGITTAVSQSAIPEKMAEESSRAADNRQLATTVVVQQHAEDRVKLVHRAEKAEKTQAVHKKKDSEEAEEERKRRNQQGKNRRSGRNLDLKA